ncbi:MAG: hypothetical protein HY360_02800 [Verrucomicrobia bacterium]|nr:hypothetical protein [Verrucomicrobiota bacterium]
MPVVLFQHFFTETVLALNQSETQGGVFQAPQAAVCNANVHKPATPTQGVLLLAESTDAPPAQRSRSSEPVSYARHKRVKR